jgi:maltodextrin utilization protein YvdJ
MLYFQTPLIDKLPAKQISDKEIKKKALEYIKKCNESRKQVKEDKNGVFIITNIEETKISVSMLNKKFQKNFQTKKTLTFRISNQLYLANTSVIQAFWDTTTLLHQKLNTMPIYHLLTFLSRSLTKALIN